MNDTDAESRRLEILRLYQILDTAAEKAFDDLTQLAAAICRVPICLVSLVDEGRQWFKSRVGIDALETPREQAFCAHAILRDEVMVIEDATADPRFADNPLVVDDPRIRFYAGAPLSVRGARLGTLCVIDKEPRVLTDDQLESLEVLRDAVVAQLELRRAAAELRALNSLLPVCAWCRKVREDGGDETSWKPMHEFIEELAPVTHVICPTCEQGLEQGTEGAWP